MKRQLLFILLLVNLGSLNGYAQKSILKKATTKYNNMFKSKLKSNSKYPTFANILKRFSKNRNTFRLIRDG